MATLHWEQCSVLPDCVDYACCVVWNGKVCIGGGYVGSAQPAQLFISSANMDSWEAYPTPTEFYALTTYHSELVLVGGRGIRIGTTNDLWSSVTGRNWFQSLLPMPTKRSWCTAVNTDDNDLDTVEVLSEDQWTIVQPLPKSCWRMESVLHDGKLYFMGGEGQGRNVYYCEVKSLLSDSLTWFDQFRALQKYYYPVSFGQHLIAIEYGSAIVAYSFTPQSWVWVGNAPCQELGVPPVVLPTGQLLIVEHERNEHNRVFKALLEGMVWSGIVEILITIVNIPTADPYCSSVPAK